MVFMVFKEGVGELNVGRPVSLLCTDRKLLSKALASRLTKVMERLIHQDQTYCVPDRSIFDNVYLIRDILDVSRLLGLKTGLIFLDQEKAFDRVEHEYLWKVLEAFGFNPGVIAMIRVLYCEIESVLKVNGGLCAPFRVYRGIRQGCSLSGMLYSLAIEPLLNKLRSFLSGFNIPHANASVYLSAYADDLVVMINTQEDVNVLTAILNDFQILSSAKVNWTKSEAILVGEWGGGQPSLPGGLAWKRGGFKYLGAYLGTNEFLNKNWEGSVEHVKGRLSRWKRLVPKMSYRGRTLVINNLAASSLWHKLACVDPPPNLLANIQAQLVDFFWDGLHWIPQSVLHLPKEEGGQGLVQLSSRAAAFRLQFLQRLLTGPRDLVWRAAASGLLRTVKGLGLDRALFLMDTKSAYGTAVPACCPSAPTPLEICTYIRGALSFAPFLSLSSRPSVFDSGDSVQCSPGPAHYNRVLTWAPVPGGHSLQNRSRRFEEADSNIPGPGTYDIIQPWGQKCHLPTTPDRGIKAFGYEENEQGDLYMQKPPRIDQSLGPAYYSPTQIEPKYKGVHFGQMTQKRTEMKVVEGPGPGHYHPEEDHSVFYVNMNLKQEMKSQAVLQIPRYPELLILQANKKGVPGPGQYDIKGQFEKSSGVSVSSPAFLSQTARFCSVKDVVPPVGSYNDPRCALESLNKHNGVKRSPFNLTAARFTPEHRKNTTPGGYSSDEVQCDEVEEKREALYKQQPTAVFKSALERLPASLDAKDTPSPSSYNVREAYEKMFGQGGHGEPRTKAARKRQSSFLSTAPRSSSFHYDSHIPGSVLEETWKQSGKSHMDKLVKKIEEILLDAQCSHDVRQMLLKLVELRSSNWGRVHAAAAYSEATPDNDPNYYM
ncbi:hypothetical protein QTP86_033694, partial [Hemibagrus guttatus]